MKRKDIQQSTKTQEEEEEEDKVEEEIRGRWGRSEEENV